MLRKNQGEMGKMALKGYWAVCEGICDPGCKDGQPSLYIVSVEGFFYADAMGPSRLNALYRARQNLSKNIQFLADCYADIPEPSSADTPPQRTYGEGTQLIFISLDDLGLEDSDFEDLALAA